MEWMYVTRVICVCDIDSKAESSLRVMRAQLDNGQRLVGVRYPHVLIAVAERAAADELRLRHQLVIDHFVTISIKNPLLAPEHAYNW